MRRLAALGALGIGALAAKNWWDARRVLPPDEALPYTVDGQRLYVIDVGPRDAPPVVLLHGSAGSCWDFEPLVAELRYDYRVVAPERLGQGWSSQPQSYQLADATRSVYQALEQLGVERPILVGHSYGGLVAMRIAAEHPEYPCAMLLLCSAGPNITIEGHHMEGPLRLATWIFNSPLRLLFAWTVVPYIARALTAQALRGNFGPDFDVLSTDQIARAKAIYSRPGIVLAGMEEAAHLSDDVAALIPLLGAIRAPTLVVTAELDTNVPAHVGEALRDAIPGAQLRQVEGVAHSFPVSRPAEVQRLLAELRRPAEAPTSSQSLA